MITEIKKIKQSLGFDKPENKKITFEDLQKYLEYESDNQYEENGYITFEFENKECYVMNNKNNWFELDIRNNVDFEISINQEEFYITVYFEYVEISYFCDVEELCSHHKNLNII